MSVEVDIGPTKTAELAASQSGSYGESDQQAERRVVLFGRADEGVDRVKTRGSDSSRPQDRWSCEHGDVVLDPSPFHSLLEAPADDRVDLTDRCGREACPLGERSVEVVEVTRCQLGERQIPDRGIDPLDDQSSVLAKRRGGELI